MLEYQNPDSAQTLREAINELQAAAGEQNFVFESPQMQRAILAHDAVHAVFACAITQVDEVAAHVWMLLGTTVTISEIKQVAARSEHRRIAAEEGHWQMATRAVRALPRILKVVVATLQMKKRFPWQDYERFMNWRLSEIRREFGIRLPAN